MYAKQQTATGLGHTGWNKQKAEKQVVNWQYKVVNSCVDSNSYLKRSDLAKKMSGPHNFSKIHWVQYQVFNNIELTSILIWKECYIYKNSSPYKLDWFH